MGSNKRYTDIPDDVAPQETPWLDFARPPPKDEVDCEADRAHKSALLLHGRCIHKQRRSCEAFFEPADAFSPRSQSLALVAPQVACGMLYTEVQPPWEYLCIWNPVSRVYGLTLNMLGKEMLPQMSAGRHCWGSRLTMSLPNAVDALLTRQAS